MSDLFAAAEARRATEAAQAQVSFIERQLPVSKLSKESYKERKAGHGQTLTPLGSYWKGRKPLILVRAVVLGLLLPATDNPARDREVFLKLMLMDDEGLRKRKTKSIPVPRASQLLPPGLHAEAFDGGRWSRKLSSERRAALEFQAFDKMGLDEKLTYCVRPEELPDSAIDDVWPEVNAHLGTSAGSLTELARQLGERRFGHAPRVGDPFCGGGSIPFEAARLGCDVYASDLNPIACLLTWSALSLLSTPLSEQQAQHSAIDAAYAQADSEIRCLGVEHDGGSDDLRLPAEAPTRWPHGWKVNRQGEIVSPDARPYEAICPKTGWKVPLVETLRVHELTRTVLQLVPDEMRREYALVTRTAISEEEWEAAKLGTVVREGSEFWLCHDPHPNLFPRAGEEASSSERVRANGVRVRIANRAKAYLYCLETRCPKTGWMVPMLPKRIISTLTRTIAVLVPQPAHNRFAIEIASEASAEEMLQAAIGTVVNGALQYNIDQKQHVTPIEALRGDIRLRTRYPNCDEQRRDEDRFASCRNRYSAMAGNELRRWENDDIVPRPDDIFQERLYCIQWSRADGSVFFAGATEPDFERERQVTEYVEDRLAKWQAEGFVPDSLIERGAKTDEPIRTRGWTHWHHLFTPRNLLVLSLLRQYLPRSAFAAVAFTNLLNFHSRLSGIHSRSEGSGREMCLDRVFINQALNPLLNYGSRSLFYRVENADQLEISFINDAPAFTVIPTHAPRITYDSDIIVSDPPYADAIVFDEILDYFISWLRKLPPEPLHQWMWDSKRSLAIRGSGSDFKSGMVAAYSATAAHMHDDGLQVVMFTHQDVGVWADLAEILWSSGLQVTAGWCIATETEKSFSEGNYVQGTVLLILRKRRGEERGYLARLQRPVEDAVREQLATMRALDDKEQPNFGDPDYQLAAYAAALKVLTRYAVIDGKPVADEVLRERKRNEGSEVERLLDRARRLASDFLLPEGLPRPVWDELRPEERFFLKGLELEQAGEVRIGAYQEMARGFGVEDYRAMLATTRANQVRLKTAAEFGRRDLKRAGSADRAEDAALDRFAAGVVRHALYGIREAAEGADLRDALIWFRANLPDYYPRQRLLIGVLDYLASIRTETRAAEAEVAAQLAGAVHNDRP